VGFGRRGPRVQLVERAKDFAAQRYRRDCRRQMVVYREFREAVCIWLEQQSIPITGFWDAFLAEPVVAVSEVQFRMLLHLADVLRYNWDWYRWPTDEERGSHEWGWRNQLHYDARR
jgi:hypothetical protein